MGVEVVGFEAIQGPVGDVTEGGNSVMENGKLDQGPGGNEPIQFGSHGDESDKKEVNEVSVSNFPKDAVDEWPAPKQIHYFYFVRHRTIDDPKIKARIDHASLQAGNCGAERDQEVSEEHRAPDPQAAIPKVGEGDRPGLQDRSEVPEKLNIERKEERALVLRIRKYAETKESNEER